MRGRQKTTDKFCSKSTDDNDERERNKTKPRKNYQTHHRDIDSSMTLCSSIFFFYPAALPINEHDDDDECPLCVIVVVAFCAGNDANAGCWAPVDFSTDGWRTGIRDRLCIARNPGQQADNQGAKTDSVRISMWRCVAIRGKKSSSTQMHMIWLRARNSRGKYSTRSAD